MEDKEPLNVAAPILDSDLEFAATTVANEVKRTNGKCPFNGCVVKNKRKDRLVHHFINDHACSELIARAIAGYPVCIENQVWGKTPGKLLSNHPSTRVPCPCFENGKGKERLRGMSQEHLKPCYVPGCEQKFPNHAALYQHGVADHGFEPRLEEAIPTTPNIEKEVDNFLIRLSLQGTQLAVDSVKTRKGNEDEEFQERDVYYLCHRSATHPSRELPNESTGSQDKDDGEASQTGNEESAEGGSSSGKSRKYRGLKPSKKLSLKCPCRLIVRYRKDFTTLCLYPQHNHDKEPIDFYSRRLAKVKRQRRKEAAANGETASTPSTAEGAGAGAGAAGEGVAPMQGHAPLTLEGPSLELQIRSSLAARLHALQIALLKSPMEVLERCEPVVRKLERAARTMGATPQFRLPPLDDPIFSLVASEFPPILNPSRSDRPGEEESQEGAPTGDAAEGGEGEQHGQGMPSTSEAPQVSTEESQPAASVSTSAAATSTDSATAASEPATTAVETLADSASGPNKRQRVEAKQV